MANTIDNAILNGYNSIVIVNQVKERTYRHGKEQFTSDNNTGT